MAKTTKKNKKTRKMIRKTLGTLFLISAIIVAAIPVEGLRAEEGVSAQAEVVDISRPNKKVTVDDAYMTSIIPKVAADAPIYTTADRTFQFAYVQSGTEYIAVLLGFNKSTILDNQTLVIPGEVDAYKQYNINEGTTNGYVAVGRSGNFLFYEDITRNESSFTRTEMVNGEEKEVVYTTVTEHHQLYPCYTDTETTWSALGNDRIYYKSDISGGLLVDAYDNVTTTREDGVITDQITGSFTGYQNTYYASDYQRLTGAIVRYIGNQTLNQDSAGNWHASSELISRPEQGVFYNCANFSTLQVGGNLQGIGNYAFYGCGALKSITLGDNVRVIGNSSFANCQRLETVNLNVENLIGKIGDHAFAGCSGLRSFDVPISVTGIGDSAFEGCSALTYVDLCSGGTSNQLAEMGYDVFKNCASLRTLTFPASFTESVDISTFVGCGSLEKIAVWNNYMTFTEGDGYSTSVYSVKAFRNQLADANGDVSFYFEGLTGSALYTTAKDNFIAFSHVKYNSDTHLYDSLDKYELTVDASDNGSGNPSMTYMVNSAGVLINKIPNGKVSTLKIPKKIGPHGISIIDDGLFQGYCFLEKVYIPSTIKVIGADAFKGCHKLENVIFESGDVSIGVEAFKTQECFGHEADCDANSNDAMTGSDNKPLVRLHFTGPISNSSGPFHYAMSSDGIFSNPDQNPTYIIYYSGWPQNLQVEYLNGKSTLTDFPAFSDLGAGTKYTQDNYAYITSEYYTAASTAPGTPEEIRTENQRAIMDAARNLVIPEGVNDIKEGLFLEKALVDSSYSDKKTVTSYGLNEINAGDFAEAKSLGAIYLYSDVANIEKEAFKDCEGLTTVEITGNNQSIGNHAFENCSSLENVSIPASTSLLGIRPFAGCEKLSYINFQNSPFYLCEDSMVFGMVNGEKVRLIECLEGKNGKYIRPSELAGINSIAEEAFADTDVKEVDLTSSMITNVPALAFANTGSLNSVKLPATCTTMADNVFKQSSVQYMEVPNVTILSAESFDDMLQEKQDITLCVTEGSYMDQWARQNGYDVTYMPLVSYYTVVFYDWNEELGKNTIVKEETVLGGTDATPPTPAGKTGYIFDCWDPDFHEISGDTFCFAQYVTPPDDYGKFTVVFADYDDSILKTVLVEAEGDASELAPKDPIREGYMFTGWDRTLTNVTESFTTKAQYEKLAENEFVVRYIDKNDNVVYTAKVKSGEDAPNISGPALDGYTFIGWRPALTGITKDTDTYAQYEKNDSGNSGDNGNNNNNNNNNNNTGSSNNSGNTGNNNNDSNNNGNSNTGSNNNGTAKTYVLTVKNGSGSGSYVAGSQPIIVANDPPAGQEFSSWTIDPSDVTIASKVLSATVITMPEKNVTITANYKAKSSSSSTTGSGNSSNNNTNRPGSSTGTVSKGTTVVIDKNGLSNTGVVSAVVNGSSDNFTIKVSESSSASESILKALMAEYGDLTNIKYFPMDISLYDSTGTKKITDTTGLSISITLPLPDSLITYAGNNKVAGVVNDKLDKLSPKFTTINGVSCITFTAEHFSPYVIYVDTNNLTAGTIADSTPKTGDGIHPKWFLSIGLACISIVLFMKKDKKTVRKAVA